MRDFHFGLIDDDAVRRHKTAILKYGARARSEAPAGLEPHPDDLCVEQLTDPQHLGFPAGLLKMSLSMTDGITSKDECAIWLDSCSDLAVAIWLDFRRGNLNHRLALSRLGVSSQAPDPLSAG